MKKNVLFAFLANLVNAGFSWIMLILIIRLGSKEDIGIFGLAQAIALPIHMFFTLKLRTIQLSDLDNKFQDTDYIGTRLYLALANLLFTIIIALIFYLDYLNYMLAISALALSYSVAVFREYYISIYQSKELNKYFFLSNTIQGFISLLIFSITFYIFRNIVYSILFYSLSKFFLILFDGFLHKKISNTNSIYLISNFFTKKNNFNELVKIGLPLGLTAVIAAFFSSIPRFQLEKYYGLESLGVFTTIMSLVVILNLFMSSFIQAMLPRVTKLYSNDLNLFKIVIIKMLLVMTILFGVFLLFINNFSFYILYFFFGDDYTTYQNEFFLAMISAVALCYFHFSNFLLNVQKTYKHQIYIYIASVIICFVSSFYLIPKYHIYGAIYSTLLCYLFGTIYSFCFFNFKLKNKSEI